MGFAQLVALSQCMETDLGGLAARLPQSTQPKLGSVLGFGPSYPQRMASLSHKRFSSLFGINFTPESPPKPFLNFLITHPRTVGLDSRPPIPLSLSFRIPLVLSCPQQPARASRLRVPCTLLCTCQVLAKSKTVSSLVGTGKCASKATVPNLTPSNAREIPESLRRMGGCRSRGDSPCALPFCHP